MPQQEDPVKKALAESKKVLEGADKFQKSAGGPMPKPQPKPQAKAVDVKPAKKAPSSGLLGEASDAAKGIAEKAKQVDEYNKANPDQPLKPYKEGGKVSKDGPGMLHKDEVVLPADEKKAVKVLKSKAKNVMASAMEDEKDEKETPAEEKKEGKAGEKKEEKKAEHKAKKSKGIHIRHGASGGFIAKHDAMPKEDGSMGDMEEHVLPNRAAVHAHIDEHMGDGEDLAAAEGAPQE